MSRLREERGNICQYCGSTESLEFHHRDPITKLFTVSRGWAFAEDRLLAEVAKCDLICINCHKIEGRSSSKAVHPSDTYYRKGCRCNGCREAHKIVMDRYPNRKH